MKTVKIGKPISKGVVSELEGIITDNELIYKKFRCNCCGKLVDADTMMEVILVDKTCNVCLFKPDTPIDKIFKPNNHIEPSLTYDDLTRTKPKKRKISKHKILKRKEQSRKDKDVKWDRFRSNIRVLPDYIDSEEYS